MTALRSPLPQQRLRVLLRLRILDLEVRIVRGVDHLAQDASRFGGTLAVVRDKRVRQKHARDLVRGIDLVRLPEETNGLFARGPAGEEWQVRRRIVQPAEDALRSAAVDIG